MKSWQTDTYFSSFSEQHLFKLNLSGSGFFLKDDLFLNQKTHEVIEFFLYSTLFHENMFQSCHHERQKSCLLFLEDGNRKMTTFCLQICKNLKPANELTNNQWLRLRIFSTKDLFKTRNRFAVDLTFVERCSFLNQRIMQILLETQIKHWMLGKNSKKQKRKMIRLISFLFSFCLAFFTSFRVE